MHSVTGFGVVISSQNAPPQAQDEFRLQIKHILQFQNKHAFVGGAGFFCSQFWALTVGCSCHTCSLLVTEGSEVAAAHLGGPLLFADKEAKMWRESDCNTAEGGLQSCDLISCFTRLFLWWGPPLRGALCEHSVPGSRKQPSWAALCKGPTNKCRQWGPRGRPVETYVQVSAIYVTVRPLLHALEISERGWAMTCLSFGCPCRWGLSGCQGKVCLGRTHHWGSVWARPTLEFACLQTQRWVGGKIMHQGLSLALSWVSVIPGPCGGGWQRSWPIGLAVWSAHACLHYCQGAPLRVGMRWGRWGEFDGNPGRKKKSKPHN